MFHAYQVASGVSQETQSSASPEYSRRPAAGGVPALSGCREHEDAGADETAQRSQSHFNLRAMIGTGAGRMLAAALACLGAAAATAFVVPPLALLFLAAGIGCGLVSLHPTVRARPDAEGEAAAATIADLGARLERRFEQLQDAQWRLNENEQRYRALLDAQDDMIVRRDAAGSLTFVNRAFLRMFAADPEAVLGQPFAFELCDASETPQQLSVTDDVRQKSYTCQVLTAEGPRWIAWEEQIVPAADGANLEVQSVGRDVTEQRQFETELAEARDAAEAASRAKSRFLAAMSHEIRTPMNGILGMASLLAETQQTPEQQTYARAIDQSARTLLALIDEILDFSKIEAGKLELSEAPFGLEACVQSVVELLAPRAHEKGLEMAWSIDPKLSRQVLGDETRVRQILLNLVSNAVKFTDTGGVCVSVSDVSEAAPGDEMRVRITVEDTGIGMSDEDMQKLFAEFEQADAAVRRSEGGTGLGLAISMQLARAMGGDIRVVSAPGKGSTFTAELSLKAAQQVADETSDREAFTGLGRVLLAFDRALERRALGYALASAQIPVVETDFAGAAGALETAANDGTPFDRLVIDGVEGAESAGRLLELARRLNPHAKVRGIVLVNVLARSSLTVFRAAGFDSYLVRPVRPSSMMMQLGVRPTGEAPLPAEAAPSARARQPMSGGRNERRVLLAEDNEINALLARRVLEKCGCEYTAVGNGAEAVAAVRRSLAGEAPPLDLVLMDIFMPQLDGIAAAREIRRLYSAADNPAVSVPPIVALTASAFAEDKKRYLEAGMDDYLAKPFDKMGLEAVLKRWFGRPAGGDTDAAA